MTYFLKSGTSFRVTSKEALDLHETLPAGNYVVKEMPMEGPLYLERIDSFSFKGKRYGDMDSNTDRILSTFLDRPSATGVMLAGEKGSGKSHLAKNLAIEAAARFDIPCIVINAPWCGDKFNAFMQSIEQPTMVLFDEFEKVYDEEDQEKALTLLDGVFPSKKLFVITCNDKWRINQNMRNRPGRLFYMLDFDGLDATFITEYCNDNLKPRLQHYTDKLCQVASLFAKFNFDMLKATVEEMNRYDEAPEKVLRMLNVKPEFDKGNAYNIKVVKDGEEVPQNDLEDETWDGNPLQSLIQIMYRKRDVPKLRKHRTNEIGEAEAATPVRRSTSDLWETVRFTAADLTKIDSKVGKFVFLNKDGITLVLDKVKEVSYNYMDAF